MLLPKIIVIYFFLRVSDSRILQKNKIINTTRKNKEINEKNKRKEERVYDKN